MALQVELIRVVQRLSFCREMAEVMAILREAARKLSGADGVTVVLREEDRCHYAEEDAIAPLWKGRRFPMQACISGWCMLHRQQVSIADIYADPRIPHEAYRPTFVQSLAMTPIRSEQPIGAIGAYWASRHTASREELDVLQALGDAASMAIANVQLFDTLKETNRRKDQFLSMLAHELRSPLAPIRNALHVLRLRGAGDPQTLEQVHEVLERQVQHLSHITDDLLDVARIATGKVVLRPERIDLARLVRQTVDDRRGVLEAAGLTVSLDVPATPVWCRADATRLAQVFGNVLDNAGKFTPKGGQVAVWLHVDESARQAVATIRDTGIGIESRILPRIFDVFAQADNSLDRSQGGLGLGLSVVKGLLDLHGGSIAAASGGIGQGTEFVIRLPYEHEPAALTDRPNTSRPNNHLRVLVVEDNRDSADILRMLLELCGYEVRVAYSGTDGLLAALSSRFDAVVCDIGLPGLDGFGVATALRRNAETARVRLIAVTGYGQESDRRRAFEAGFDAHLVKPVEPETLLGHLSKCIAGNSA